MVKTKIKIQDKIGRIQSREIKKQNKPFYNYNRKLKAWIKKPEIEIKKIKFIRISKRKEKRISKKVQKEIKVKKEKLIKEKIRKPIQKKVKEEIEEAKKLGYPISLFKFHCHVSDVKIDHCFTIRTNEEDFLLDFHENNYPDHQVIDYELYNRRVIEYGKGSFYSDRPTQKQKDFLISLGASTIEMDSVITKTDASRLIEKLKKY